ncbi:MAG TPA: isoprenylcysteine carboxylmethyltransferase family protein [Chitinophagales bacterium]|nr:isoprenylcysteine carboxylmethyltransferase family protein [Chitinophagales bacterium]
MASLFLRNLFFTILQPGIVAGLIPFFILGNKFTKILSQSLSLLQYLSAIIFLTGFAGMLMCIISFAVRGQGTLSPADPTKKLVVSGLYRFSRNPMYVGVMMMLVGEFLFFQSPDLLLYSIGIFTAFNIFIILFEEPRLRKDFGKAYDRYCEKVRRWI